MKIRTQKILIALAEAEITKQEFAAMSGISRQSLSKILRRGSCEPITAGRIARAMNISVSELMEEENDD